MDVAAPPPSLVLTGERSPFSHPVEEDGMRALIRFEAAGDILMVPLSSPLRWRQSLNTCVVQTRFVYTYTSK
jgi:hypothetical protein